MSLLSVEINMMEGCQHKEDIASLFSGVERAYLGIKPTQWS